VGCDFGGMKLIVPPHWDVRTEVSNIAAGWRISESTVNLKWILTSALDQSHNILWGFGNQILLTRFKKVSKTLRFCLQSLFQSSQRQNGSSKEPDSSGFLGVFSLLYSMELS